MWRCNSENKILLLSGPLYVCHSFIQRGQRVFHAAEKHLTALVEPDAASPMVEQGKTQLPLQRRYGFTQG